MPTDSAYLRRASGQRSSTNDSADRDCHGGHRCCDRSQWYLAGTEFSVAWRAGCSRRKKTAPRISFSNGVHSVGKNFSGLPVLRRWNVLPWPRRRVGTPRRRSGGPYRPCRSRSYVASQPHRWMERGRESEDGLCGGRQPCLRTRFFGFTLPSGNSALCDSRPPQWLNRSASEDGRMSQCAHPRIVSNVLNRAESDR